MKNLVPFKHFLTESTKSYGQEFNIADLKPGTEIMYQGTPYFIISVEETVVEIAKSMEPGEPKILVNQSMFNEQGFID